MRDKVLTCLCLLCDMEIIPQHSVSSFTSMPTGRFGVLSFFHDKEGKRRSGFICRGCDEKRKKKEEKEKRKA